MTTQKFCFNTSNRKVTKPFAIFADQNNRMSEHLSDKKIFSLTEVTSSIQKTLEKRYSSRFWVRAEMNKLNYYIHTGNCYPDILQKENGRIVAQMRSVIWKKDYDRIAANFLKTTGEHFRDGITIVFLAGINYSANHGIGLQIYDIDPLFTLGELELEKRQTIQQLKENGLWDQNKKLQFPVLPKRLAVISVKTSKGYADFLSLLNSRMKGYRIDHLLFPSLLQGEKAIDQMILQLNRIEKLKHYFDCVAIIRGGGGEAGLSVYNNYRLAARIADFPLPVITGIGHATNLTVAEMVAHTNAITPSELADLLLESFEYQLHKLNNAAKAIQSASAYLKQLQSNLWHIQKQFVQIAANQHLKSSIQLAVLSDKFSNQSLNAINHANYDLNIFRSALRFRLDEKLKSHQIAIDRLHYESINLTKDKLAYHRLKLEIASKSIDLLHPDNVLKRGYSITLFKGKSIYKSKEYVEGEQIITILANKEIQSTIQKIISKNDEERK